MASSLLRMSALRGSAFRRALSAAAAAAPSAGEGRAARRGFRLRFLSQSTAPDDHPPKLDEEVRKIDQMQKQVEELDQLIEQDINKLLDLYEEYKTADHSYFERFLSRRGVTKSKARDDFIWHCEITTLFVLSIGVGYLLAGFSP